MTIEPRPLTAERRAEIARNAGSRAGIEDISGDDILALLAALLHAEQRIAELEGDDPYFHPRPRGPLGWPLVR